MATTLEEFTVVVTNVLGIPNNNYFVSVSANSDDELQFKYNYIDYSKMKTLEELENSTQIFHTDSDGGVIEDTDETEDEIIAEIFDHYKDVIEILLRESSTEKAEVVADIQDVLQDLSKEEILDAVKAYSAYVAEFYETHDSGSFPVCFSEFYTNDYLEEDED